MKRIIVIGLVLILSIGLVTTALASPRWCVHCDCFCRDGRRVESRHHFWDSDGNFLSRAEVEANLNAAVAAGTITVRERDLLLERYDFCAVYGCGAPGVRRGGACRGFGRGAGPGVGRGAGHGGGHAAGRGIHCR